MKAEDRERIIKRVFIIIVICCVLLSVIVQIYLKKEHSSLFGKTDYLNVPEQTNNYGHTEDGWIYFLNDNKEVSIVGYESGKKEEINVPEEIEGYVVTSISERAFMYNTRVESISIPNTVVSIGNWAFAGCENLEYIKIPSSVITVDENTFLGIEDDMVICTTKDAYIAKFAKDIGIKVKIIN